MIGTTKPAQGNTPVQDSERVPEEPQVCAQCEANARSNESGGYHDLAKECRDYCRRGHKAVPEFAPSTRSASAEIADELARIIKWMRDNEPVTVSQIADVLRNREGVNRIEAIRKSRAELAATSTPCEWKSDEDGIWHTSCDNAFFFDTGGPEENKLKFCGYCGKTLKEVRIQHDDTE